MCHRKKYLPKVICQLGDQKVDAYREITSLLTRLSDSVTVTVDAVVYYRIFNPTSAVIKISNTQYATRLLSATTLRNILGTKTLQEILQDRESIAHHIMVNFTAQCLPLFSS